MKKFKVTVQAEIIVEFDEKSEYFKDLWANYKDFIDSEADFESFAESIASMISRYGISDMIEGVGYVKHNGKNQRIFNEGGYKEEVGYVNVEVDTDINNMVDFEIYTTEDLSDED